jgi:peptide/nickel transport system substrate-binding protein
MEAGDVQVGLDMTEEELPTIARLRDQRVVLEPSLAYEQVSLNQADPNPTTNPPPPWVGDPAVSQALDLAIDRPALRQGPGDGRSPLAVGPISPLVGWAHDPGLFPPSYNLAQARRILDADGWKPGPGGVRVKDGRRLAFTLTGPAGEEMRAEEEDILVQSWRRLGADVQISDAPSQLLFASYQQGGLLARGMYQAAIWSWIPPVDPDVWYTIFASSQIPSPSTPNGQNLSRCHDPAIDQSLAQARGTLDMNVRAGAYRAFQQAYVGARCEFPLLQHLDVGIVSPRLHNFVLNASPAGNTWNADDWWLG